MGMEGDVRRTATGAECGATFDPDDDDDDDDDDAIACDYCVDEFRVVKEKKMKNKTRLKKKVFFPSM
jgi:DNA-directed RNA polymerase subunit RPC12/RpoP